MKKLLILAAILSAVTVQAQIIQPIKWKFSSSKSGSEVELRFTATMEKGWHLYDTDLPDGGPIPTAFVFEDSTAFTFVGKLTKSPAPTEVFDKTFAMNLRYFSDSVTFTRKLQITDPNLREIKGTVNFMGCDDESCLPPEELPFSFMVGTDVPAGSSDKAAVTEGGDLAGTTGQGQSMWIFILISLAAGFAAVLTPCVFPMIPMTVSFFMRGSKNRGKALRNALFFGFSILAIFAILGGLFSFGIFGPNVGSILSTHWLPNALFFILFFIFALSFFGLFEIVLPGSLVNKTDAKAESGGFMGAFFMALTTVIVSFSCTGPFIGALIIQAVQNGGLQPLIGMFFFGLAFATPFTLLAIFPSAMNKLPKSGGWLNSIKVVFAFILLAFGLKFLSNIDQVYGFGILNREIYLSMWIVIFAMMGFYFLGKIRFEHDSDMPHLGVGRLLLSMVTFTFVVYLFTGLLGAPLKSISALIPPPTFKQQPVVAVSSGNSSAPVAVCGPASYSDKLHLPQGLTSYFVYEEGAACAKEQNKPLLVVFKGHACANCKKMENSVWTDPEVLQMLAEKYVIVGLYTDDRTTLPEGDWVTAANGNVLKTMGKVNLDMQIAKYGTNSIPYHVVIEPDGTEHKLAVTFDNGEFRDFIRKGIE